MQSDPLVVSIDKRAAPLQVVGTNVTVLANEAQTGEGAFTLQSGEAGMGPPPHSHPWAESFYVTKGSVVFFYNGDSQTCEAGSLVWIPPNTTHTFQYGPEGGEMLEITGSKSQASQLFTDLDAKLEPGPPDIQKVTEIFDDNNVALRLPPS